MYIALCNYYWKQLLWLIVNNVVYYCKVNSMLLVWVVLLFVPCCYRSHSVTAPIVTCPVMLQSRSVIVPSSFILVFPFCYVGSRFIWSLLALLHLNLRCQLKRDDVSYL